MKTVWGNIAALWGIGGTLLLLGYAIWRLSPLALELVHYELSWLHWAALVANIVFMAYSEGYKGFQKGYSPRVAARCLYLSKNVSWLDGLLAPLFVMGYFHTTRRRLIGTYLLTVMIVGFIIIMQYIDQPLRGILDAGVVVGLMWGTLSLIYFMVVAFTAPNYAHSPELNQA